MKLALSPVSSQHILIKQKSYLQWRNPITVNNHDIVCLDTSPSPKPLLSALPSSHEHTLKKQPFQHKNVRQILQLKFIWIFTICSCLQFIYSLWMLQTQIRRSKRLALSKCNSFQGKQQSTADSLLKPLAQTPTSFRGFIWIKAKLKLFWDAVSGSFSFYQLSLLHTWWTHLTEINTSILDFFTTQLSWFTWLICVVSNNKMHYEKECFEVLTTSFFLESVLPFQGHFTALHGWSHFSLSMEIFKLATNIFLPLQLKFPSYQ